MASPGAFPETLKRLLEGEGLGTPYMGAFALPERPPAFAETEQSLPDRLREALAKQGIEKLFTHQAHAYDAVRRGEDVCAVTGTNSGKTLCYMLPAYATLLEEPVARVLAIYPTKALAQDQLGRFEALRPYPDLRCGVYDGDTPQAQRSAIRKVAQVVLTNPDMLHVGILPGHERWAKFFKSLRLIVVDEMHVYRGIFGSHVASILRRLLRICAWYGSKPRVVGCTATIGNPSELFERLVGRAATVIDEDGSGQPRKTYALWNPAGVESDAVPSPNTLSARLMVRLAEQGKRNLVFCRSRIGAELVLRYAREAAEKQGRPDPRKLESYRSGYTAAERRKLEQAIFKGDLLGLSCTNAMELGVDIGVLDAVVVNGYPGTVAGFRQQCGRAGRGQREGMAIFVAHEDPLEQYFVRDPEALILGAAERISLNPSNPNILEPQLRCAAYERPLDPSELESFGPNALETAEALDRSGELAFRGGRFFYPFHEAPASKVDIRGEGSDAVTLFVGAEALGTMERWRALQYAHEGAVYLHRGNSYQVTRLDLSQAAAWLEPFQGDYFTQPVVQSVIEPMIELAYEVRGRMGLRFESIRVTDIVSGFRRRALEGGTVLDEEALDLPPMSFETVGIRFDLPPPKDEEEWPILAPEVHGLEHALIAVAPLLAGCDRGDLGSAWYGVFPNTLAPAVYVFDRFAGGMGLSEKLFANAAEWFEVAHRAISGCNCVEGCPKCLYLARCEIANDALSKPGAIGWLEELLVRVEN